MSRVNIVPEAYIGSNEFGRIQSFLYSMVKTFASFIIRRAGVDPSVVRNQDGSFFVRNVSLGRYQVSVGVGVDKNFNIIRLREPRIIEVPVEGNPNSSLYLLLKHATSTQETGTVNVSTTGDLTGTGTFFRECLRGYPGEPTYVRFPNATLNVGEYPIAEVNSNTSAIINALDLFNESNLKYEVLSAFPSNVSATLTDKKTYLHDDCDFDMTPFLPTDTQTRIPIARFDYDDDGALRRLVDLRDQFKILLNP